MNLNENLFLLVEHKNILNFSTIEKNEKKLGLSWAKLKLSWKL